jgi:hypothetical protein
MLETCSIQEGQNHVSCRLILSRYVIIYIYTHYYVYRQRGGIVGISRKKWRFPPSFYLNFIYLFIYFFSF